VDAPAGTGIGQGAIMTSSSAAIPFRVERIGGHIGAIIHGIDLADPISDQLAQALRETLWRHKVIFFRGQTGMTDDHQATFAGRMGKVISAAHPTHGGKEGNPMISALDSEDKITKTNRWHTDTTFVETVPAGAVLRAIVLPSFGGDTLWANAEKAYADLPDHLKAFAGAAWGVHSNRWGYAHSRTVDGDLPPTPDDSREGATGFSGKAYEAIHPLVRIHPHTRKPSIVAGNHLRHILGLSAAQATEMASIIQQYVTLPENTVRWRWAPGDVAVWDNEATQHLAVADYDERRIMHRISLVGEAPESLDGRRGYQRIGSFAPVDKLEIAASR
jgi:alpha-ketoglutarate-dependent taurine dioxygenase